MGERQETEESAAGGMERREGGRAARGERRRVLRGEDAPRFT